MDHKALDFRLEIASRGETIEQTIGISLRKDLNVHLSTIQSLFRHEDTASIELLEKEQRAWTRSHLQDNHIAQTLALANRARKEFSVLVTIGIGGSDLGARVFHDVLNHPYHNTLSLDERGGGPEVYFTGNTFDPFRLKGLLEMLKGRELLSKTIFNVISKSGCSAETIATLMIIRNLLQQQPGATDTESWRKQVLATTSHNGASPLYQLHQERPFYGNTLLPIPEGVGGRFSALSPVGLFFLGITAGLGESPESRLQQALQGIKEADELFRLPHDDVSNVPYHLAKWLHLAEFWEDKTTVLFYNYADNHCLGDWFVQLYEESLQERGLGLNVITARGPTSNHSQLNGIIRGPRDKVVLFIVWNELGTKLRIPTESGIGQDVESYGGLTMNQAQTASYYGTAEYLNENEIPNATLHVPRRDAHNLCKVMRVSMDSIAIKGRLQVLHVDNAGIVDSKNELTYRQDGVEKGKAHARRIARKIKTQSASRS